MSKEEEVGNDMVIPRAAGRSAAFLGVIQKTCRDEGLELNLQPAKRGWRDDTIVLRAPIKAGKGNSLELEVFADPQGNALHVGWQANRETIGGPLANIGIFADANNRNIRNAGKAGNQRALSGILQSFNMMIFQPVVQQLMDAVRAEQAPKQNGFMDA